MSDENERSQSKKRKKPSAFSNYRESKKRQRNSKLFEGFRGIIRLSLGILFLLFLMSGLINQRKTGQTLANFFVDCGMKVYSWIDNAANGKVNAPVEVNEDGVYLKNADVNDKDVLEGTPLDKEKVDIDKAMDDQEKSKEDKNKDSNENSNKNGKNKKDKNKNKENNKDEKEKKDKSKE